MVSPVLTTQEIFRDHHLRLRLEWVAGKDGGRRTLSLQSSKRIGDIRLSIIGHLNLIQQHAIQVIGVKEFNYLGNLPPESRTDILEQLLSGNTICVIASNDIPPDPELIQLANQHSIPLLTSNLTSHQIIEYLQYRLSVALGERTTVHGVYLEVMGIGVLLAGVSGIGKSELALELLSRGHRLIADDAPEFSVISPDTIAGTCPRLLQDMLEVRGLGILNVRRMFGHGAIKSTKYLRLVIELVKMSAEEMANLDRLQEQVSTMNVLGVSVPMITLPVAPGRNLAVMVEAAVRNHLLHLDGYDATADFMERQRRQIQEQE